MDSATLARAAEPAARPIPFDTARLDELLQDAGIDALLVTSKHNVQYLLGGYRFFFFDYMDAIGVSRYLPVLVYRRGRPEEAAYIGYRLEAFENELGKFWTPAVKTAASGSVDAIKLAVEHVRGLGRGIKRIGTEASFLPADADAALRQALPECEIVDAHFPLEKRGDLMEFCKKNPPARMRLEAYGGDTTLALFDVLTAGSTTPSRIVRRDEAKTLGVVEPLDSTCRHLLLLCRGWNKKAAFSRTAGTSRRETKT